MNKVFKTAAILLVVGLVCLFLSGVLSDFNPENYSTTNIGSGETRVYECSGEIYKIIAEDTSVSVTVESGDVDRVTVSVVESDRRSYDITEDSGILEVRAQVNNGINFGIDSNHYEVKITVPKDKVVSVGVTTTSGSITVQKVNVTGLVTTSTSGSISIFTVNASEGICAESTSGSIGLTKIETKEDILVSNTSGSKKLLNVGTEGNLTVGGSSGSIKLTNVETGGNISLSNTSGSISGSIVGSASDYSISSSTTSGSNNLSNSTSGAKKLDVRSTSGSVNISFTK